MTDQGQGLLQVDGGTHGLYIGGKWVEPHSGAYLESKSPIDGGVWYQLSDADSDDADRAVQSARLAFEGRDWRAITPTARGELLRSVARAIRENLAELARLETMDNGKLLKESRNQISHAANIFDYYAGMADKIGGNTTPATAPDVLSFTLREPVGVVAVIVPWNSPLYLLSCTVAPALAMGNTLVMKPSEHASATSLAFCSLFERCGFPPGVLNLVTGVGVRAGAALTGHPGVSKVAFTGSALGGRSVATSAAVHSTPVILELGGKSPHVVFADADLDRAVNGMVAGVFAAGGQTCTAGSRCLVERSIFDEVVERFATATQQIRVGDPMQADTQLGPLALLEQRDKVEAMVSASVSDGAKVISGGVRPADPALQAGWFYTPTVLADVNRDMDVVREEIFGPVATLTPFDDEESAISLANDSKYGLAAGVWTTNIDRALRFAKRVDAGVVWVNTYRMGMTTTPSGGFKESGYGKRSGFEGALEYTRLKSVIIDHSGISQDPFIMRTN